MSAEAIDRRRFIVRALFGASGLYAGTRLLGGGSRPFAGDPEWRELRRREWGFLVDTTRCIGCGACVRACKAENQVPDSYFRTWVERYEIGRDGNVAVDSPQGAIHGFRQDRRPRGEIAKAFFVPKLCNHCASAPCIQVCPIGATFRSPDGVVLVDKGYCMGCGYCIQACPYGARFLNPQTRTADKCSLCYHRLRRDLMPACVEACPRQARLCGNRQDERGALLGELRKRRYAILKPEMYTAPSVYYIGLDLEVK